MATATLNADQVFNVGSAGQDATKWKLYDSDGGSKKTIWEANLSNNPAALTLNQFYRVRANQFVITQPIGSGGMTEDGAKRSLAGLLAGSTYLELFNASDASVSNLVKIEIDEWTIA